MNTIYKKTKKGSAIAYGLVLISVVSIILMSMVNFVVSQLKYGYYVESKETAFHIAESGINYYRWYLAHNTDGRTVQQIKDFWQNGSPKGVGSSYVVVYKDEVGNAIGEYQIDVTPPNLNSTIIEVQSVGYTYKYPNLKRTIKVRLRRPSWSEYTALGNNFLRFGDGTAVTGKLFANGGIHFDGVSQNIVYAGVTQYYDSDNDVKATKPGVWTSWANEYNTNMNSDVFVAGKNFPIPVKDFSAVSSDLNFLKAEAQAGANGSLYFDNTGAGRRIILKTDGTFDIRTVQNFYGTSKEVHTYNGAWSTHNIPEEGMIFVEGNIWLEGTINNEKVTIVAANLISSVDANVFIKNDIKYTNHDGTDILGIIAQDDIEITENSEDNLEIDAALLAVQGRVGRDTYNNQKNTITVYGAIATNKRYGFTYVGSSYDCGSFNIGMGYCFRNLNYDNNLLYYPPPYFPTGDKYLIDLWEEL
ncbi:MAG: hypothetical protein ACD_11C00072G0008 [uncultured bacterium]|nr:MAG: hypothetical protein ACD_11C00072G0008 [uncultured bacterium]HBR71772.1 hypothetical protein [Candidatus Moranbacteria bacterium]